ncbi:MAG: hypothetical protein CM1200mP29_09390 [Verrucomicrobiota bacterium]|nr:MAG: hypothetical protein CM1200mP29_09390 [Verrucomicrobiota bacterium]
MLADKGKIFLGEAAGAPLGKIGGGASAGVGGVGWITKIPRRRRSGHWWMRKWGSRQAPGQAAEAEPSAGSWPMDLWG